MKKCREIAGIAFEDQRRYLVSRSVTATHPLKLVLLERVSRGTVGSLGTKNSYTKNAARSENPRIRGARTCAELQEN